MGENDLQKAKLDTCILCKYFKSVYNELFYKRYVQQLRGGGGGGGGPPPFFHVREVLCIWGTSPCYPDRVCKNVTPLFFWIDPYFFFCLKQIFK